MTKLFIDTCGWLTLDDRCDRYHQEATEAYQRAIAENGQIYTTDCALDETITFSLLKYHQSAKLNETYSL